METINDGSASAQLAASVASGDKVMIRDVSAIVDGGPTGHSGWKEITFAKLADALGRIWNALTALTGINAANGDTIRVNDVSAAAGEDNGDRSMTLAELALALNRTTIITGDGAITIQTGSVSLTKGSAAAITLAAPSAAQEGTRLVITAGSAFAHVVTATGLIQDGVTGGAKNTATFGAFVGSSIILQAVNLKWHVIAKNVVTVA